MSRTAADEIIIFLKAFDRTDKHFFAVRATVKRGRETDSDEFQVPFYEGTDDKVPSSVNYRMG